MAKETVLVTGASAGIGRELARLFAADGSDVVLVARRRELLEQLAAEITQTHGVQAQILCADLSDPGAPETLAEQLTRSNVTVDVLVNNAGFGAVGAFAQQPVQQQLRMIQVNLTALTHLARLFLPPMIERGRGGLLNVGSTAGFQAGPGMAIYYATKAFVLSLTEALAEETAGTGVRVTCLAPGPTKTEFAAEARMQSALLFHLGPMSATAVARTGYRGFRKGKLIVIPGLGNRLGAFLVRLVPRAVARKVAARLNRLPP